MAHLELQFGQALPHILWAIVHSDPTHGPVYLIKIDLVDSFYWIHLVPHHVPLMGMAFPMAPGQQPLVVFPLALLTGWTSSPPIFCMATETATDLANTAIQAQTTVEHHRLNALAEPMTPSLLTASSQATSNGTKPLVTPDMFVDVLF